VGALNQILGRSVHFLWAGHRSGNNFKGENEQDGNPSRLQFRHHSRDGIVYVGIKVGNILWKRRSASGHVTTLFDLEELGDCWS